MKDRKAKRDELFIEVARVLHAQPIDEVMPVLITATARALVMDAQGDLDKLDRGWTKFSNLVRSTIADMLNQDLDEAREATKQ